MSLLMVFIVAVSLSMDAFSLALIYGTLSFSKKMIYRTSIMVGLFHFFMPLCGFLCGNLLSTFFSFQADLLVGIIFIILSIQMMVSIFRQEEVDILSTFLSYLLFSFTVSIDSFSVGIGMGSLGSPIFLSCIIFSVVSFLFTFIGLLFGKHLASKFGRYSTILGSVVLFWLGIFYVF